MSESQTYDFNFFRPNSAYAKANTRLICTIVFIWAIAVFGFHFYMKAIEKAVPEKQLTRFEEIWPNAMQGNITQQESQELAGIYLNLIGRHIPLRSNEDFKLGFTSTLYGLLPFHERAAFLELTKKELSQRKNMTGALATMIGLEEDSLLAQVVPYALVSYDGQPVSEDTLKSVPSIMSKYMIHNRSVLTDTKFLGFPFHYFYTAVFLLVLFVGLCLVYCKAFDKIVAEHGMEDDEV